MIKIIFKKFIYDNSLLINYNPNHDFNLNADYNLLVFVILNIILEKYYAKGNRPDEALGVFNQMVEADIKPNEITYTSLIYLL